MGRDLLLAPRHDRALVSVAVHRCSECGKSLARANAARRKAGLPRLAFDAKTRSPECATGRQKSWTGEWWATIAHRKLVHEPRSGEPWRCAECGIDAEQAARKRRRLGLWPLRRNAVVCSPQCGKAAGATPVRRAVREAPGPSAPESYGLTTSIFVMGWISQRPPALHVPRGFPRFPPGSVELSWWRS